MIKHLTTPELKVYLYFAIGFAFCNYLTHTWLPAVGLMSFSDAYGSYFDNLAPYLILPTCLLLTIQNLKRGLIFGIMAIAASLVIDYYFFIQYFEPFAWGGLLLLGIATVLASVWGNKELDTRAAYIFKPFKVYLVAFIIGLIVEYFTKQYLLSVGINMLFGTELKWSNGNIPVIFLIITYLFTTSKNFKKLKQTSKVE